MKHRAYFDPPFETIRPNDLLAVQEKGLRAQLAYVTKNSSLYKEKFRRHKIDPRDIHGLRDLKRLPFTTKAELRENQANNSPGIYLTAALSKIRRIHGSSGTTGRSVYLGLTTRDALLWTRVMARSYYACGLRPGDIFLNCWTYHLFTSGVSEQCAIERLGAAVVPIGTGYSDRLLMIAQDLGANAIGATPSYILHLAELVASKLNKQPPAIGIRKACLGGEVGLGVDSTRRRIEDTWQLDAREVYGLSDVLSCLAGECSAKEGMHFLAGDSVILELIDPKTGNPLELSEGAEGEAVYTTIGREASPVIRYRSRDMLKVFTEKCSCGRTSVRFRCLGRIDDALKIKGVLIYPGTIEAIIRSVPQLTGEYQIVVDRKQGLDVLAVVAEVVEGLPATPALASEVSERIRTVTMVRPTVEFVNAGTLPRTNYKGKRVLDKRSSTG